MIEISNFRKLYGTKVAVEQLDFTVEKGTICGFIGHNGAGKTSTLKAIAGIHSFDQGEIRINGYSIVTETLEAKKSMAYVPDNPDVYGFMTGMEFIQFICDAYQVPQAKRQENISYYATAFEIQPVLHQAISSYSHGMKQKVVLTSALVHEPSVLVLDEPFVGLDPKASNELKGFMRKICEKGGCILYSTHVLEVAQHLCHDLAMIKDGKLVLHGKTAKILQQDSLETLFLEVQEGDSSCS